MTNDNWVEVSGYQYRKSPKGIMSNFHLCMNYGAGICEKIDDKPRPCAKCEQFKY